MHPLRLAARSRIGIRPLAVDSIPVQVPGTQFRAASFKKTLCGLVQRQREITRPWCFADYFDLMRFWSPDAKPRLSASPPRSQRWFPTHPDRISSPLIRCHVRLPWRYLVAERGMALSRREDRSEPACFRPLPVLAPSPVAAFGSTARVVENNAGRLVLPYNGLLAFGQGGLRLQTLERRTVASAAVMLPAIAAPQRVTGKTVRTAVPPTGWGVQA